MKKRKLLTTVMAGALVASQMVMPAMAAGGTLDVNVTEKTAVLRVEVPTSMEVALDEFEVGGAGSQIYSDDFTMTNKSAVDVKVEVTSTVAIAASGVALKDAPSALKDDGDLWMAAVAKTTATSYGATSLADLTEESVNVATVDGTSKEAKQTFYLAKGTGNLSYKEYEAEGTTVDLTYADLYKLTALTLTAGSEQDDLDAAIAANDVYVVVTASDEDGAAVTKIEKGTSATWANTNSYYTAAATVTEPGDTIVANDKFVYAETATAGGEAAFRYIGKLGENADGWTTTDVTKVSIAYTISGVGETVYNSVKDDVVYGLYTAPAAPSLATSTFAMVAGQDIVVPVNLGVGTLKATSVKSVAAKLDAGDYDLTKYFTFKDGELTLPGSAVKVLLDNKYNNLTIEVTFNNDATVQFTMKEE